MYDANTPYDEGDTPINFGSWDEPSVPPSQRYPTHGRSSEEALGTPGGHQSDGENQQPTFVPRALTPEPGHAAARPLVPRAPSSVEDTGLTPALLQELALKHAASGSMLLGSELATRLHLPLGVVEEVVQALRRDGLLELMSGGTSYLGIAGMRIRATEHGAEAARQVTARNGYVGPAPVSLHDLEVVLRQQAAQMPRIERGSVHAAITHLVLPDDTIDRLGAGLEHGGPILLYGHAGNGKTALAASIAWMLGGGSYIPYAVAVDDYILCVHDPDVHVPLPTAADPVAADMDTRWVYCQRPFVRAGAELRMQALDLHFNSQHLTYDCPLQLKASGGVLLLDDLGAQQAPVLDMLHRCLEPLASGNDYLTTVTGRRIPVPFTPLLVLATSADPLALLSETHLRRLPCKIEVPDPTEAQFRELLRRACGDASVEPDQAGIEYLIERCYSHTQHPMRAAHPTELVRMIQAAARYFDVEPRLEPRLIDLAADSYFIGALVGM